MNALIYSVLIKNPDPAVLDGTWNKDHAVALAEAEENLIAKTVWWLLVMFGGSFFLLMAGIEAPYGRYVEGASKLYGCQINGLFAWVVQEIPNLFALVICTMYADPKTLESPTNVILLAMFGIHYVNRTLIFPFRIRGGKNCAFMPFAMATAFCTVNGYLQCRTLTQYKVYPEEHIYSLQFVVGVTLWAFGFWTNLEADDILRNLRKPGDKKYYIPKGGMFDYVSGANFFGEILEWTGFALAAGTPVAMCFAATTALNIGPRAVQHHRWYLTKFKGEYPQERRALIPFIF